MSEDTEAKRPLTARPVGIHFSVETRGHHHTIRGTAVIPQHQVSDNFIETDAGCYRRMPTCED